MGIPILIGGCLFGAVATAAAFDNYRQQCVAFIELARLVGQNETLLSCSTYQVFLVSDLLIAVSVLIFIWSLTVAFVRFFLPSKSIELGESAVYVPSLFFGRTDEIPYSVIRDVSIDRGRVTIDTGMGEKHIPVAVFLHRKLADDLVESLRARASLGTVPPSGDSVPFEGRQTNAITSGKSNAVVGVVFFLAIVVGAGMLARFILQPTTGDPIEAVSQHEFEIGQPVESGRAEVTITSVSELSNVGSMFMQQAASQGAVLVVVDFTITNTSDQPLSASEMPTIELIDANGVRYSSDIGKTAAYASESNLDAPLLSDLNPGITVSDAEVFQVSRQSFNRKDWYLLVNGTSRIALADLDDRVSVPSGSGAGSPVATVAEADQVAASNNDSLNADCIISRGEAGGPNQASGSWLFRGPCRVSSIENAPTGSMRISGSSSEDSMLGASVISLVTDGGSSARVSGQRRDGTPTEFQFGRVARADNVGVGCWVSEQETYELDNVFTVCVRKK